ncbi:MAG TPA: sulfite exporter TauE/SafE family protein [Steroidobacteraceae bacterium]|nr:sulfite exporter TauE/SafE family protein [Steroidobacteraceae bacterium]
MTLALGAQLFSISLLSSLLGGVLGMASGIFIVPLLVGLLALDIRTAITASIISVVACSCGGAGAALRAGLVNIRLAVVLEVATTLGALSGVLIFGLVPKSGLYGLFAAILVLSAYQMLRPRRELAEHEVSVRHPWAAFDGAYPDGADGKRVPYRVERLPLGMGLMYGAGLVSALLGIGSGVLKIPAMDTALRLPIKVSTATSTFMIGVTGVASAGAYMARGLVAPSIAGPVVLGSVLGAALGAHVMLRLSGDKLRIFFVAVLVLLAVEMLIKALGVDLGALLHG